MRRRTWRRCVNAVMLTLTGLCALFTVSILLGILGFLVWKGGSSINLAFFTRLPKPVNELGGGMANAIVGSGKILLLASLLGVPVGFVGGVYMAEFGHPRICSVVRYAADLLNGVPSIVLGIVVYALVVRRMHHFSAFAGSVALAVMLIPIVLRATEDFLRAVPRSLREGALGLGATRSQAVLTVIVPAAYKGIATGVLLAIARIAGETAPLLFTSFNNRFWSSGWNEPTATLPVMIFTYAISPYDDWHRQAWAAGLVLLGLILSANVCARLVLESRG
jgi:phosphate transport system permease protein